LVGLRSVFPIVFISRKGKVNPLRVLVFPFLPSGRIMVKKFFAEIWRFIVGEYNYQKAKDRKFQRWRAQQPNPSKELMLAELKKFGFQPKISLLVPVHNTPVVYLEAMVNSVMAQIYTNWELCLADDCSGLSETLNYLKSLNDPRIRILLRPQNGHIAECSNSALEMASGEYSALLDHDDLLNESALFWVVKTLNENSILDFLYSDECKIDDNGNLGEPTFKPMWSPDTLLSHNYPGHLVVCKTELMRSVGGFIKGQEGSQDYDLYLRISEKTNRIAHIPKILYYWRKHPDSVSSNSESKPYAYAAAGRALQLATARRGEFGELESHDRDMLGFYTFRYPLKSYPKIAIVILVDQFDGNLKDCLHSLLPHTDYTSFQVILVSETEGYSFGNHPLVSTLTVCGSWAQKINTAVQGSDATHFVVLDASIRILESNWLTLLAEQLQRDSIGVVGPKLIYPDNTIFHAGMYPNESLLPENLFEGVIFSQHHKLVNSINNYPFVTSQCLAFRKDSFEQAGGFDTRYASDMAAYDFCLKLSQSGKYHVYVPHCAIRFLENRKTRRLEKDGQEFIARWTPELKKLREHSLFLSLEFSY
jgi:glycosyltransferase involved in cell wall biosynthesis